VPESYGKDGRRWLADHPGWRVEPGLDGEGYYAWRPDGGAAPVAAGTLDDLAGYAHEAEAAGGTVTG
jgi:hypothetical protein